MFLGKDFHTPLFMAALFFVVLLHANFHKYPSNCRLFFTYKEEMLYIQLQEDRKSSAISLKKGKFVKINYQCFSFGSSVLNLNWRK